MFRNNYIALLSMMKEAAIAAGDLTKKASPEQRTDLFIADDRVTVIDIEAGKVIRSIIEGKFAGIDIISEEESKADCDSMCRDLSCFTGFFIDPIDGSVNFSRMISPNYGNFAVSIGYAENGAIKVGVIYKPLENELFHAIHGEGAFQDGKAIRVSQIENINHASIELGSYWIRENQGLFNRWFTNKSTDVEQILIRGSAAAALADVARGRIEAVLYSKLHPWDYAAGWLLVEEAGGVVMDGDFNPLKLGSRYIYATNKNLNRAIVSVLQNMAS